MLGSGIFSIFGAGLNAAINSGIADEQWGNQLRLMEIQNRYNEQMAKNSIEKFLGAKVQNKFQLHINCHHFSNIIVISNIQ